MVELVSLKLKLFSGFTFAIEVRAFAGEDRQMAGFMTYS